MLVRVLIVDPQPFFCEALATALQEDERIDVVGWATGAREADRLISSQAPDVVLCDVSLAFGPASGLLHRARDGSRLIVLTRGHEGDALLLVAGEGASGCISHDTGLADLSTLVVDAASGRFVVDPDRLGEALRRAGAARREEGEANLARLTSREREILDLLIGGLDDLAIASHLHLSAHTVRTHVGNVLRKLEVRSRAEAARLALQAGGGRGPVSVLRIEGPSLREP